MKKLIAIAFAAASLASFGAFSTAEFAAIPAIAPVSVSAGSTNSVVIANSGIKGVSEVFVTANAAANRTSLDVALYATNAVSGGWSLIASGSSASTNAAIVRVPFPGEYATKFLKVCVGSVGANSIVSSTVLTTK